MALRECGKRRGVGGWGEGAEGVREDSDLILTDAKCTSFPRCVTEECKLSSIKHLPALNVRGPGTGWGLWIKQMAQCGQGLRVAPNQQPGRHWALSLTARKELNPPYNHTGSEANPSPVKP